MFLIDSAREFFSSRQDSHNAKALQRENEKFLNQNEKSKQAFFIARINLAAAHTKA